jgi:hypothetical protein
MTPIQYLNQFSVFMLPGVLLLVAAGFMLFKRAQPMVWMAWAGALMLVVAAVLAQRTPQTTAIKLDSVADIRAAITSGRPALVEFYSNY